MFDTMMTRASENGMKEQIELKVNSRDFLSKGDRLLYRQEITLAHLLGHGLKSLALQCDTAKIERSMRVKDIAVDSDITVLIDPEQVVVTVLAARPEEGVVPEEILVTPPEES